MIEIGSDGRMLLLSALKVKSPAIRRGGPVIFIATGPERGTGGGRPSWCSMVHLSLDGLDDRALDVEQRAQQRRSTGRCALSVSSARPHRGRHGQGSVILAEFVERRSFSSESAIDLPGQFTGASTRRGSDYRHGPNLAGDALARTVIANENQKP